MAAESKGCFSREMETLLYLLGYQAQKDSCRVFAAGNFMRDLVLGSERRTIDVLVDGDLLSYVAGLQRSLPGKMQYSEVLETATLHLSDHIIIKLIPLKSEVFILAAEPDIQANLKNELFRQDFTINTLAMELNPNNFCKLYDYFGGEQDIDEGIIRVLYNLSFVDEPLRLLRALRLEQRYGFTINDDTVSLMHTAVATRVLHKVSRERIGRELRLILAEPAPSRVLRRLYELGLWEQVFPRLLYKETVTTRLHHLERIEKSRHQLAGNNDFRYNTFIVYLSALLYGLSRHDLQYLSYMLRLKKKEKLDIMKLLTEEEGVIEENVI